MSFSSTELTTLLQAELETLSRVAEALSAEHAALISNSSETLESAIASKNQHVEAHSAQQQKRLEWMAAQGLSADTSLAELVAAAGGSETLASLRERLSSLAQECQEANRRNGGLIVRLQERVRGALDVLRQEDSRDLYSLSGAREHRSDSRTLGKA